MGDNSGPQRSAGVGRQRYMIADRSGATLADLLSTLENDPEIRVVSWTGPPGAPDTFTVEMSEQRARKLKDETEGRLIIERDLPLGY